MKNLKVLSTEPETVIYCGIERALLGTGYYARLGVRIKKFVFERLKFFTDIDQAKTYCREL